MQNDIIGIYDSSNNLVARYEYDAWGNHKVYDQNGNLNTTSYFIGNINPFRYRSYYYDRETNLYYCYDRYYNPDLCRWMSLDGLEYLDHGSLNGMNLYVYCNNDPINMHDPSECDAIYVVMYGKGGLPIVGHARLYYQDKDGNWRYTEYAGKFPFKSSAKVKDRSVKKNTEELLEMFKNNNYDYVYLEGNFSSIKEYASKMVKTNFGEYNLLNNNCLHYVRSVLKHTGMIYDIDTIIPALYRPHVKIKYNWTYTNRGQYRIANSGASIRCYFDNKMDLSSSLLSRYKI